MSTRRDKKNMAPFIVSASDLAFIMLFFFLIVGNGSTQMERIEMPYKQATKSHEDMTAPFRIEIYDQNRQVDSSRMALIYSRSLPPETTFVMVDNRTLSEPAAYSVIHDEIYEFFATRGAGGDSLSVDVYSSAHSYYGLVALALAACHRLEYPCNLVYRAEVD